VTITAPEAFVTNNSFTLDTTDETQYYLFLLLQQRGVEEFITGSAQPQITLSNIAQLHIVCPARPVLEHFHSLVAPAFELRYSLEARLDNLCAIRDLLLPRLVSGEIDVLNLNMAIPELAA
jgi:type I restriction enzyme S subunit